MSFLFTKSFLSAVLILSFSWFLFSPTEISVGLNREVKELDLENESLYLILRGSETKMGGYARQYNKYGGDASHIAVGIFTDSLMIYHVNTNKKGAFVKESLERFTFSEKETYDYLSIWKVNDVSRDALVMIQQRIDHFETANVRFDYRFDLDDDESLYCSEFAYKVLSLSIPELFTDVVYTKAVPESHRFFLKRDTISYIPTDFFVEKTTVVEKVFEWERENNSE